MSGLGRNKPPDQRHIEKYPLSALPPEIRPTHVPVCPGTNWYTDMDEPVQGADGIWRITTLNGSIRGGHCYCLEPAPDPTQPNKEQDTDANWTIFNQAETPACEGFGHARQVSLVHGKTFDAFWLYDDARRAEGAYPNGEGSLNRSALSAMQKWGAHTSADPSKPVAWHPNAPGVYPLVTAYRWATTAQEVLTALGVTGEEVTILNSWGTAYPHRVKLPASLLERLLHEEGEADVITER